MCYIELTPLQAMCFLKQVHKLTIFQRTKSCLSWMHLKPYFKSLPLCWWFYFICRCCCCSCCFSDWDGREFQISCQWRESPLVIPVVHQTSVATLVCFYLFPDVHFFCCKHPPRIRFGYYQATRPRLACKFVMKKMRITPVHLIAISMICRSWDCVF